MESDKGKERGSGERERVREVTNGQLTGSAASVWAASGMFSVDTMEKFLLSVMRDLKGKATTTSESSSATIEAYKNESVIILPLGW